MTGALAIDAGTVFATHGEGSEIRGRHALVDRFATALENIAVYHTNYW